MSLRFGEKVVVPKLCVLGEDRAVYAVLRVVVGCERERRCGKDQHGDDMDDLKADSSTRAKMTLQLTHA